jgi:hypothetical protein
MVSYPQNIYSALSVNFVNLLKTGDWEKLDISLGEEDDCNIDMIISYIS